LKIHWMWWPAVGGLAMGLGGLVFPQALGVGYDTIGALLQGSVTTKVILGVLIVKWFIWAVSLGSGKRSRSKATEADRFQADVRRCGTSASRHPETPWQ
jgi:Voltage gated chloride channel